VVISFCFYNLNGFVDLPSQLWSQPKFVPVDPNMINFMEYNRDKEIMKFRENPRQLKFMKILCDVDRVCDVEDSVYDWNRYDKQDASSFSYI